MALTLKLCSNQKSWQCGTVSQHSFLKFMQISNLYNHNYKLLPYTYVVSNPFMNTRKRFIRDLRTQKAKDNEKSISEKMKDSAVHLKDSVASVLNNITRGDNTQRAPEKESAVNDKGIVNTAESIKEKAAQKAEAVKADAKAAVESVEAAEQIIKHDKIHENDIKLHFGYTDKQS